MILKSSETYLDLSKFNLVEVNEDANGLIVLDCYNDNIKQKFIIKDQVLIKQFQTLDMQELNSKVIINS